MVAHNRSTAAALTRDIERRCYDRRVDADLRERLRAVHRRERESHQRLFDLQGESIRALREALSALSRTHDEMMPLFASDNALEDIVDDGNDTSGGSGIS